MDREDRHSRSPLSGNPDIQFLIMLMLIVVAFAAGIVCGEKILDNKFQQIRQAVAAQNGGTGE